MAEGFAILLLQSTLKQGREYLGERAVSPPHFQTTYNYFSEEPAYNELAQMLYKL